MKVSTAARARTRRRRAFCGGKKPNSLSCRGRKRGIMTPSGFQSPHDLRCSVLTGCDLKKAFPQLAKK